MGDRFGAERFDSFWLSICVFLGCRLLTKPAGPGRLPPRVGVGIFCGVQFAFAACSPRPPPVLPSSTQHPCPAAHPSLRSPTFPPTSVPRRGTAVLARAPQPGVPGSAGTPQAAELASPSAPLPFCILQSDIPRAPSSAVTACPADRRHHPYGLRAGDGGSPTSEALGPFCRCWKL